MGKNTFKKQPSATTAKKPSFVSNAPKPEKKKKKPFVISKVFSIVLACISLLSFAALSAYYLIEENSDLLFTAQSKGFFSTDDTFFDQCITQPGGIINYIAAYLTQMLYHPALGASILIAMWMITIIISKFAFKVKTMWMAVLTIPAVCLLVGIIDVQYWVFYLKQEGYWFYGTVGFLICMLLVLLSRIASNTVTKSIIVAAIALTYPAFGWYSLLAAIYSTVNYLLQDKKTNTNIINKILPLIVMFVFVFAVPYASYYFYPSESFIEMWACGFPYFTSDTVISIIPEIPYFILAAIPLIFPFVSKVKEAVNGMAFVIILATVAIVGGSAYWISNSNFEDYNYHAEMRMHKAAEEMDWDKVLDEMSNNPGDASRQMVLLKNVALMYKGEMGSKMFKYNNMGDNPANTYDSLRIHMAQTAAPLIYYYHGKTNFSIRWCIENSVECGYDFENLMMLTRCAILGNEMDCAKKYINILKTSLFYKDWAEKLEPITENPELIKEYHEFDNIRELRDHMGSVLDGDNGLCEMYLLNYFANTMNKDSKYLQELTLNYSMVQKDIKLFWPRFFLYASMHPGEDMPVHYQEAALLYGNLEPGNVDISKMPFDQYVKDRYANFQQVSQSLLASGMEVADVGQSMKTSFGDTFFWFYFFCRDIHSY